VERKIVIIRFLDRKQLTWYKIDEFKLKCSKHCYKRGELLQINQKQYCVVDDHFYLRVYLLDDQINPFGPIVK
jgi:hypothetical protein